MHGPERRRLNWNWWRPRRAGDSADSQQPTSRNLPEISARTDQQLNSAASYWARSLKTDVFPVDSRVITMDSETRYNFIWRPISSQSGFQHSFTMTPEGVPGEGSVLTMHYSSSDIQTPPFPIPENTSDYYEWAIITGILTSEEMRGKGLGSMLLRFADKLLHHKARHGKIDVVAYAEDISETRWSVAALASEGFTQPPREPGTPPIRGANGILFTKQYTRRRTR